MKKHVTTYDELVALLTQAKDAAPLLYTGLHFQIDTALRNAKPRKEKS